MDDYSRYDLVSRWIDRQSASHGDNPDEISVSQSARLHFAADQFSLQCEGAYARHCSRCCQTICLPLGRHTAHDQFGHEHGSYSRQHQCGKWITTYQSILYFRRLPHDPETAEAALDRWLATCTKEYLDEIAQRLAAIDKALTAQVEAPIASLQSADHGDLAACVACWEIDHGLSLEDHDFNAEWTL